MASLSYHFIEQPLRHGRFATRRFIAASSALCASVLLLVSGGSLLRGGNLGLYSPEAISLDKARAPTVPYKDCNARTEGTWCTLGDASRTPSVFLWGDSHLLAWAPALNSILEQQGVNAIFAPSSTCPPILGVTSSTRSRCAVQNLEIKQFIAGNPSIKTVLLSGYWSYYFSRTDELALAKDLPRDREENAAQAGLIHTIEWLANNRKQIVLLGPVPIYENSVPQTLAIEAFTGKSFLHSSKREQYSRNTSFFQVVDQVKSKRYESFLFLDPITWLCAQQCVVAREGISLYRDEDHLSVAGALSLQSELARGLDLKSQAVAEPREIEFLGPKRMIY